MDSVRIENEDPAQVPSGRFAGVSMCPPSPEPRSATLDIPQAPREPPARFRAANDDDIRPGFRRHLCDLQEKLAELQSNLGAFDRVMGVLDAASREAVRRTVYDTEGYRLHRVLDEHLTTLRELTLTFTAEEHARHASALRTMMRPFILQAPFMARCNLRPRGYAGDAEMMCMCYENGLRGETSFGRLLHRHPVEHPAAQAVRNRRVLVKDRLLEQLARAGDDGTAFRALSLACGPAWELADIAAGAPAGRRIDITLLDQDDEALALAGRRLAALPAAQQARLDVSFVHDTVRSLLRNPATAQKLGTMDFIYSMGLFDYLREREAKALIRVMFGMLRPGGSLVVGNFHVANPSRVYMEYWLDWYLEYRTEEEMDALADGLDAEVRVSLEATGSQMFLEVRRRA